jgi:FkbM family methyltransferase
VRANVGYYTRSFSELVGDAGSVFAFEPSPTNFARLSAACGRHANVRMLNCGLGSKDGQLPFQQGTDDLGATSRVVDPAVGGSILVNVRTGTTLIETGAALSPNAIKIDVEGYELEVLEGLGAHLSAPDLRLIGVEVHFGILKSRGIPDAPRRIERLLRENGFAVSWPDASHILATRLA